MGTQVPPPKKKGGGHSSPHISAMYCGQTAEWIKMPFGTEVVHTILCDGNLAPPPVRGTAAHPHFSAHIYCGQTVAHLSYC